MSNQTNINTSALQNSETPKLQNSLALSRPALLELRDVEPWPTPVDGKLLLDALVQVLRRFVVLPLWGAETLALWILHTFAFKLRDVSTYIGIESPEKRCGKTTLLTVLNELANRAVPAANISPPAFFRVIEDLCPTLLIDEGDTFLNGNDQLRGILNAGYKKKTGFVWRAINQRETSSISDNEPSIHQSINPAPTALDARRSTLDTPLQVQRFSCWCPKVIATIGLLPDTLADRCIVIRMQRKTRHEQCERLRKLDAEPLKQQCARFVLDHVDKIAVAQPDLPAGLSDRAADIWEPLVVLADLAGGDWPQKARQAAVSLSATAHESNPIGTLLTDIFLVFIITGQKRMFTKTLIEGLVARSADRPWADLCKGKEINAYWLGHQLRPYGIKPRTI